MLALVDHHVAIALHVALAVRQVLHAVAGTTLETATEIGMMIAVIVVTATALALQTTVTGTRKSVTGMMIAAIVVSADVHVHQRTLETTRTVSASASVSLSLSVRMEPTELSAEVAACEISVYTRLTTSETHQYTTTLTLPNRIWPSDHDEVTLPVYNSACYDNILMALSDHWHCVFDRIALPVDSSACYNNIQTALLECLSGKCTKDTALSCYNTYFNHE